MVFFNYATMQMAAKIVYYGPGLCGKTTNLRFIYEKTSPQSRGEMVSLETETDRTLFFDLLPLDVGVIGGFKTRLQLYTVPGQVFYNTTRKLVLKGVDGIVFVVDSQRAMLEANKESFRNLRDNLNEIGLSLDEIPLVIQLNKRDLPNVAERDVIVNALDPTGVYESVEASAMNGNGVFETLKVISKLTLRTLRRRMMGEEVAKAPPVKSKPVFQVHDNTRGRGQQSPAPAAQQPPDPFPQAAMAGVDEEEETLSELGEAGEPGSAEPKPRTAAQERMAVAADVDSEIITSVPTPSSPEASEPFETLGPGPGAAEPAVESAPPPDVRRLKVRSSIDIMEELEQLRKKATQTAAVRKKEGGRPKETARTIPMPLSPDALGRARRLQVTFTFQDGDGDVIQQENRTIDLEDSGDLRSVTLDFRNQS